MALEFSKLAKNDLDLIVKYTKRNGASTRQRPTQHFFRGPFASLRAEEQRGRTVQIGTRTIQKLLVGRHLVFFDQIESLIFVSRILHGAMQLEKKTFPVWQGEKKHK